MSEPTIITCIDGRFTKAQRAAVPVADRGFRFGDGVFETVRIERGVPYQWELHMERLAQGLEALAIRIDQDWAVLARKLLDKNQATAGFIRLAVSRGVGSRGYQPFPPGMPATFVLEYLPPLPAPTAPYRLHLSSWAKIPANCLPAKFKLAQGANSILALQEAQAQGADEALQLNTEGFLSEAASANLFWIAEGVLFTPSLETDCLSGTTREALMRLSHLPVRNVREGLARLEKAEAVGIANVRLGLHPVSQILPMGWRYPVQHADFLKLQRALERDRTQYSQRHAALWKA